MSSSIRFITRVSKARRRRAELSALAAGTLALGLTLAGAAAPASAYSLFSYEANPNFLGFGFDPLNIDVCYDSELATGDLPDFWPEVIERSITVWNEATTRIHFRSLKPTVGHSYSSVCDVQIWGSVSYYDKDQDGVVNGKAKDVLATAGRTGYINQPGNVYSTGRGFVILNDSIYRRAMTEAKLDFTVSMFAHELGHVLGLAHPAHDDDSDESLMSNKHWPGRPMKDDIDGIEAIYGKIPKAVKPPTPYPGTEPNVTLFPFGG